MTELERPFVWQAGPDDIPALAEVQAGCFVADPSGAWGAEYLAKLLTQRAFGAWLLAPEGSRHDPRPHPVGFILMQYAGDIGDIASIGVLPEWRRQGFGEHLLVTAAAAARANGAEKLLLEVAEDNHDARSFYQSVGFDLLRVRRGYYDRGTGARINALVLNRSLVSVDKS